MIGETVMKKGLLVCISGPSGVGKGTIVKALLEKDPMVTVSISATTREPRTGETEGIDYFYKSEEEFARMIRDNELLEWAEVHGHHYGTPKAACLQMMESGKDVILEIDVQGSLNVMKNEPDTVSIFILPPDAETLKSRLVGRGTETQKDIAIRLGNASGEVEISEKYDYLVVNNTVEGAVEEIRAILCAEKLKQKRAKPLADTLIQSLKEAL